MLILSKLSKEDASFQKIRDNNDAPPEWNDVASSQAFLSHSHNQVPLYYTTIHQASDHNLSRLWLRRKKARENITSEEITIM